MSKKIGYLLGILLVILIGTFFHWKLCCPSYNKQKEEKVNKTVVKPDTKKETLKETLAPFGIGEVNDQLLLKMKGGFSFENSNFVFVDSLSKDVHDGASMIKEYLDKNGEKRFNITGFYRSDEENTSAFPNLGLARANDVKNFMISKGISSKAINTFGELNEELTSTGIIYDGINLNIGNKNVDSANKDEEALKVACEALKDDPLVLHFNTSQATISLSETQREKFAKITNCVDKLGATVKVTGHTDATGNADHNIILGQNRADFAKTYLISNGIPASKITATSKGQTEPISENTTATGRSKNRRTVITIE